MEEQILEILQPILGNDIDKEIIDYMLTIKLEDDLDEFLNNIINPDNKQHQQVVDKLKSIIIGKTERKKKTNDDKFVSSKNSNSKIGNEIKKKENEKSHKNKNKKSFVKLDTSFGSPQFLKQGRRPCDCEARSHPLINNCLQCGRIVCEQEGSGPCFFCDNMVARREEMEILNSNTKESDRLYNKLVDQKKSNEWKKAIETRNRLIKADRIGEVKKKIYDDQFDYFDSNAPENSETQRSRMFPTPRSKAQMILALNIATKTFTDEAKSSFEKNKSRLLSSVNRLLDSHENQSIYSSEEIDSKREHIKELVQYIENNNGPTDALNIENLKDAKNATPITLNRVVNQDLTAHVDKGLCLTMHQPWASLLVAGVKKHEGRTWKTDHRGRLWIHAASKEPTDMEILTCEEFYRQHFNDTSLQFPRKYPVSCLLGCVFVEDCLDQKTYREKYPNGESESPYVLICSNPVVLPIFLPMSGQHKIFQLSKEIHRQAKDALLAAKWF